VRPPGWLGFVPVGLLARVPWAALPLADGRRLCETCEVVLLPGLRLAMASGRAKRSAQGPPLVVAADPGGLEAIEHELAAIHRLHPGARTLRGPEATAAAFLECAPRAEWIHFAGHGVYRAEAPHQSGLRFADRWLTAEELAGLGLAAHWVTLSACQSGRARIQPGEEWFGLARSFLLAGARHVIAAQWDVGDEATARLMAEVYEGLAAGQGPVAALAGAQREAAARGVHPLDWAGFGVLGPPPVGSGGDFAVGGEGHGLIESVASRARSRTA
jgi:CHAT domain-containing protein